MGGKFKEDLSKSYRIVLLDKLDNLRKESCKFRTI